MSLPPALKSSVGLACATALAAAPWLDVTQSPPLWCLALAVGGLWSLAQLGRVPLHLVLPPQERVPLASLALPLGWLAMSWVLTLLAAVQVFHAPVVTGVVALAGVASHVGLRNAGDTPESANGQPPWWLGLAWVVTAAFVVVMGLVPTLYYDALVYHFAVPRQYLDAHAFTALPGLVYAAFPFGVDLMMAVGIAADPGGTPASLMASGLGLWSAFLVGTAAAEVHGHARAGHLATFLWLTGSLVVTLAVLPTNDLPMVTFGCASALVLLRHARSPHKSLPHLAAVLLGGALFTKNIAALQLAPAMALLLAWALRRAGLKTTVVVRGTLVFSALAVVVAAPTFVRNAVLNGNPFFPALWNVLGGGPWSSLEAQGFAAEVSLRPLSPSTLWEAPGWMFRAFFLPEEGLSQNTPGILLGATVVLLGWNALRHVESRRWVGALLLLLLAWALTSPQVRFLGMPAALVCVAGAGAWWKAWDGASPVARAALRVAVVGACVLNASLAWQAVSMWQGDASMVASGLANPRAYAAENLDYPLVSDAAVQVLGAGEKVMVVGEGRSFHLRAPVFPVSAVNRSPLLEMLDQPDLPLPTVLEKLRGLGVGLLLVRPDEWSRLAGAYAASQLTPGGRERMRAFLAQHATLVMATPGGRTLLYALR